MGGRGSGGGGGGGGGGGPLPPPEPPKPIAPEPEPEPPKPEPEPPKPPITPTGKKEFYEMTGAELRPLVLEIGEQEEKEVAKINEEIDLANRARWGVEDRIEDYEKQIFYFDKDSQEYKDLFAKLTIERQIRDDLRKKRDELEEKRENIRKEHRLRQYQMFYVKPGEGIEIDLTIGKSTKLYKENWKERLKPQKEFLEKVVLGGGAKVEFKAKGRKGGGGESSDIMRVVEIGVDFVGTTPLHEYIHQVEHQLGLETTRSKKFKEYIEKRTGKKLEDIEMKELSYHTDASGKESHYGYGYWVPKIFKTPKEENDYGYMFRFYPRQVYEKGGKRYAIGEKSTYRGNDFAGTEFLTKAFEHIYKEPAKFAKEYPEIFDIAFDVFRGK